MSWTKRFPVAAVACSFEEEQADGGEGCREGVDVRAPELALEDRVVRRRSVDPLGPVEIQQRTVQSLEEVPRAHARVQHA